MIVLLSSALAGAMLFAAIHSRRSSISSVRSTHVEDHSRRRLRRETTPAGKRLVRPRPGTNRSTALTLAQFSDPKSVAAKPAPKSAPKSAQSPRARDEPPAEQFAPVDHATRRHCQIVYILGVEGATHHGFLPILEALARAQTDPATGRAYAVDVSPASLKAGLFGWYRKVKLRPWGFAVTPPVDDPALVQRVVRESCPRDGRRHVLIEWASFPSGHEDDPRTYRVHRQHAWLAMSPEEVANSKEALRHPTNMNAFYQAYSPYVDIKFVVLHRPFLETIASHRDWDGGPEVHSNIIRGFMLMLRRFLDTHLYDLVGGGRLWSLVCVQAIMAKNYASKHDVTVARKHVVAYLSKFLDWPNGDCPKCFDDWRESTKDAREVLGEENVPVILEHMEYLEGIWPPPGEEGIEEQQCEI